MANISSGSKWEPIVGYARAVRITTVNEAPVRPERGFVLYWMTAFRRTNFNFALERAVEWSAQLAKPLIVLEALRVDYPWASDRMHRFIVDGMADNQRSITETPAVYYPYIERAPGEGKGLIAALGAHACVVVTDDFPAFFLPGAVNAAAQQLDIRLEAVDSNGIHALRAPGREFKTAHEFRRWLQSNIYEDLLAFPAKDPLTALPSASTCIPDGIAARWPVADLDESHVDALLRTLPIDHTVAAVRQRGGSDAARAQFDAFLARRIRYDEDRNQPDREGASGLSPYLHFGHISSHDVFRSLADAEGWSMGAMSGRRDGGRAGFWGMCASAEAFLDQLITWRELGFNACTYRDDYDRYESLPEWSRRTLEEHASDPRPEQYTLTQLERAETSDGLWNAAQTELVREGRMHNYLRMLWGKKILEWSSSPRDALNRMIQLNNKYALDGRDPNSYSGIFWVLGRYDRAWGPRRPIFGTVRYMSSTNTARKLRVREYVERYAPGGGQKVAT